MVVQNRETFRPISRSVSMPPRVSAAASALRPRPDNPGDVRPDRSPGNLVQPGLSSRSEPNPVASFNAPATPKLLSTSCAWLVAAHRRHLRNHERRRFHGAPSGTDQVRPQHKLKLCTIGSLIKDRREREKLVERIETVRMPTEYGDSELLLYHSKVDAQALSRPGERRCRRQKERPRPRP